MTGHLRLGVNIDHVATVRNARGSGYPDPVRAALLAVEAGADGITAHLREDRRHITDDDIARLATGLTVPLNLEMAATDEMLAIALKHRPHAACIVPEKREERTTEGGLDVVAHRDRVRTCVEAMAATQGHTQSLHTNTRRLSTIHSSLSSSLLSSLLSAHLAHLPSHCTLLAIT